MQDCLDGVTGDTSEVKKLNLPNKRQMPIVNNVCENKINIESQCSNLIEPFVNSSSRRSTIKQGSERWCMNELSEHGKTMRGINLLRFKWDAYQTILFMCLLCIVAAKIFLIFIIK